MTTPSLVAAPAGAPSAIYLAPPAAPASVAPSRTSPSSPSPSSSSLCMRHTDAIFAGVGMLCGLVVFSRDFGELFGGAVVLSFLLLAVCNEDSSALSLTSTPPCSRARALVHAALSWTLLWSTLISLEATAARWSTAFAALYAVYFFVRGRKERNAGSLVGLAFFALALCVMSSRLFAVHVGAGESLAVALACHCVWWSLHLVSNPRALKLTPRAVFMDAPLLSVRDVFRLNSARVVPSSSSSATTTTKQQT